MRPGEKAKRKRASVADVDNNELVSATDSCGTVFSFFGNIFKNNKAKVRLLILLAVVCLTNFLFEYIRYRELNLSTQISDYYALYNAVLTILFSAIIVIGLFRADWYDNRIKNMISAFPNSHNHKVFCNKYYRAISPWKAGKMSNKWPLFCWIGFSLVWEAVMVWICFITYERTRLSGISGITVLVLFFLALTFAGQMYYNCVLLVCFYQRLTGSLNKEELLKFEYNKEQPSQTVGFVQHVKSINGNSITFLSVSLLYMIAFIIIIHLRTPRSAIDLSTDWAILVVFVNVFFITFSSNLIVLYVPKLMLNRVLQYWVEKSKAEYQTKLFDCYKVDPRNEDQIKRINEIIKQLGEERLAIYDNHWSLIVSIVGALSPFVTLIVSMAKVI